MDDKKIARINELYKKKKDGTITAKEKEEQAVLRAEYIETIRNNTRRSIESMSIKEPDGTIIWKQKKKCVKNFF